ncbi:YciI family protein [Pedobacter sp. ASV28]|jgi:hypothetical protein|uniref:YciI family protein n=1 Tax=Pedobacter sp. ASV28 TaxID=2795123 RepID=UPI0018EAA615|nr:YciI family protein [Pedobacter sp. ASV28]
MKEFLMLIRESADYGKLSFEEMQDDIAKHMAWVESLVKLGHFKDGNPLEADGAIIKGSTVTDGPFVEAKECISGYYFLIAESLAQATQIAKGCPDLQRGSTLELREVILMDEN